MKNNSRKMLCTNSNSKFKGILLMNTEIVFIFYPDSENCFWPVSSSLFELVEDFYGWVVIGEL